jgi:beta-N-acetylhexosaminidase
MNAGQLIFTGIPGADLDAGSAALLTAARPGGVVLFGRNLDTAERLVALVAALRALLPGVVLAVDAEGGRVDRFKELLGPSPTASLLARQPPAAARLAGRWTALGLRLFDVDLDLAPVADLDLGETGNALAGRYLGARPPAVTQRAGAFLRGLHSGGVGGCVKHFPGLGAAAEDTHFGTSVVRLSVAELAPHLKPFASLLPLAGAAMVAHAVYPALDPRLRPASLSPLVAGDLLRGRMRFDGLALSDDLEMKALAEWGDLPRRAEAAFAAGCDVLLVCETLAALPEIAARLAHRRHAARRAQAAHRLAVYRQRLQTLRWTVSAARARAGDSFGARLAAVRAGRTQMLSDLQS